jgi:hypothetical protein
MGAGDPKMPALGAAALSTRSSGNGPQHGPGVEVRAPADGSVVASVPDQGAGEVGAAVARLRRNQPAWEALGYERSYDVPSYRRPGRQVDTIRADHL